MFLVILRILVGVVFLVSGFEKALGPSANFLYVIQAYDVIPLWMAEISAVVFPWIEITLGAFLVLGLWLRAACLGTLLVSLTFIVVVGQAILRELPLDNCGCFGDLIHLLPQQVILLDILIVTIMALSLWRIQMASRFSLDRLFESKPR